ALEAGGPVTLTRIDTIARTLGARRVCDEAWSWSLRHQIQSLLVSDDDALAACRRFAETMRMRVEPACGAALAAVYGYHSAFAEPGQRILVIVCGGIGVYPELAPD
ncbi:MAG: serine dehydratase, partial [Candidatus Melainabacteria bacterium HGW-Melainabacteria-1]